MGSDEKRHRDDDDYSPPRARATQGGSPYDNRGNAKNKVTPQKYDDDSSDNNTVEDKENEHTINDMSNTDSNNTDDDVGESSKTSNINVSPPAVYWMDKDINN